MNQSVFPPRLFARWYFLTPTSPLQNEMLSEGPCSLFPAHCEAPISGLLHHMLSLCLECPSWSNGWNVHLQVGFDLVTSNAGMNLLAVSGYLSVVCSHGDYYLLGCSTLINQWGIRGPDNQLCSNWSAVHGLCPLRFSTDSFSDLHRQLLTFEIKSFCFFL